MASEAIELERPAREHPARPDAAFPAERGGGVVLRLWRAWRERAWLRRELPTIDARILRDIGITREALEREAEKPIWRL